MSIKDIGGNYLCFAGYCDFCYNKMTKDYDCCFTKENKRFRYLELQLLLRIAVHCLQVINLLIITL